MKAIGLLIHANPSSPPAVQIESDSLSPVAPFRVVNIGNSEKIKLLDFIDAIEVNLGMKAVRNYMPMQLGDVPATLASVELLGALTGYIPDTNYKDGKCLNGTTEQCCCPTSQNSIEGFTMGTYPNNNNNNNYQNNYPNNYPNKFYTLSNLNINNSGNSIDNTNNTNNQYNILGEFSWKI